MTRKSLAVEGLVQEDAGVIARERTAGTVRAVQTGSEADDEQLGARLAERRDGTGVVAGMLAPDPVEMGRQPRTVAAPGVERRSLRRAGVFGIKCRAFARNNH